MPALKSTPFRFQSFHQSQATLPGLIQEVSPICWEQPGVHQIAGWHLGIVLCDGEDAPRIIAFAGAGCDVIAGALYVAHVSPRVVGHLLRVGSKGGSQDSLLLILFAAVRLQPHARILLQVALQDSDFAFPQSMVAGRKAKSCLAVSSRVS